jgi:hypothetical protein
MSTPEELKFVKDIAVATGIVLDPVYRCNIILPPSHNILSFFTQGVFFFYV